MPLTIRHFTPADARAVARWRYSGQFTTYDVGEQTLLGELDCYRAVVDSDAHLVGFYCTGSAARVPELAVDDHAIDLGVGMAPDHVGRGEGLQFGRTVLDHAAIEHGPRPLRAVVQSWNERSLKLARRLGFIDVGLHTAAGVEFIVLHFAVD